MAKHLTNYPESKYKPEHCELLIKMMETGSSVVQFCAALYICKDTFYEWRKEYPAFKKAHMRAIILSEAWWTNFGLSNMGNPDFNATMYHLQMGSRFGVSKHRKLSAKTITGKSKPVKTPKTITQKLDNVLLEFEDGEISIDEFKNTVDGFAAVATLKERDELAMRLEAIEKRLKQKLKGG